MAEASDYELLELRIKELEKENSYLTRSSSFFSH